MDQSLNHTAAEEDLPQWAVEVENLVKVYGSGAASKRALDGMSLAIPRGSIFGLLGPNGAGKSTFINILAGLVMKTSGTARIWNRDISQDPRGAKCAIGVVPQELNLDPFFTPREMLEVQAGLFGVHKSKRRTMEILDMVGLTDKADSSARSLSGGMRRRLLVAKAMVHSPPILVLDEPTAGVDVELRRQLWEQVMGLNAQGVTIILTTHYLEEAEQLCDRIAIIDKGALLASDTKVNLLNQLGAKRLIVTLTSAIDGLSPQVQAFAPRVTGPNQVEFQFARGDGHSMHILDALRASGLEISDISTEEAGLEDVFLRITSGQE